MKCLLRWNLLCGPFILVSPTGWGIYTSFPHWAGNLTHFYLILHLFRTRIITPRNIWVYENIITFGDPSETHRKPQTNNVSWDTQGTFLLRDLKCLNWDRQFLSEHLGLHGSPVGLQLISNGSSIIKIFTYIRNLSKFSELIGKFWIWRVSSIR